MRVGEKECWEAQAGGQEGGDNIHPLRQFSAHSLGCGKLNVALHKYKGTHTHICMFLTPVLIHPPFAPAHVQCTHKYYIIK